MYHYNIFQLPVSNKRCFMPVNYDMVNLADYVHVYSFDKPINEDLENIYEKLNIDHPADYHARSLSTSDLIVERNDETRETKGYVVDIIGFKEVEIKNGG